MKLPSTLSSAVLGALAIITTVSAKPGDTAPAAVAIPWTPAQISGNCNGSGTPTANYRAYTNPGDPFRIVVPEPNTIAEPLIYADYAGLKLARQELIAFTGIDTPNNLRPIDVFITGCTWTGYYHEGITGFAGVYNCGMGPSSYIALFTADKPNIVLPFTEANALRIESQLLSVHEYTHLLFMTRCTPSPIFEDVCKTCSFYVGGNWVGPGIEPAAFHPLTDPSDEMLNSPQSGRWIYELGKHHGASWAQLRQGFQALAAKFDAGGGESANARISENQIRWILNAILVNDTKPAFLAVGVPAANLPTRSVYFPYFATGGVSRTTFRFPAPAATKGKLEGLLYLYNATGQPQSVTLTAFNEGGFPLPDKNGGPIHAVVSSSTATRLLASQPAAGEQAVGWARFDSLAPIAAEAEVRREVLSQPAARIRLPEPGVTAATSFTLTANTAQQAVAIINPGAAPIKVGIYTTRGLFTSKTPVQIITIAAGHQYLGTVAELTLSKKYKGKLRLQSTEPCAAMTFRLSPANTSASPLNPEQPLGKGPE